MTPNQISPDYFVSPQVTPGDLPGLVRSGIRGVVNMRPDAEEPGQPAADEIGRSARALGLAYRHIPMTPGQVEPHQVAELAAFLQEVDGPVLGFCRGGARAEALWRRFQEGQAGGR